MDNDRYKNKLAEVVEEAKTEIENNTLVTIDPKTHYLELLAALEEEDEDLENIASKAPVESLAFIREYYRLINGTQSALRGERLFTGVLDCGGWGEPNDD